MALEYSIPYEVPAETAYAAIIAATALLRTGVEVRKVRSVNPTVPGWYEVVLEVVERYAEQNDPITAAKAEAYR